MSGVLFCLAAAALAWPPRRSAHRPARLRTPALGRPGAGGALVDRRAAPWLAAVLAVSAGAVLSTVVVAGLAGGCTALGVRAVQGRRRTAAEQRQIAALAEALGVLAAELRAGRSVDDAAGTAVAGCPEPTVAAALGPVLRLGVDPDTAAPAQTGAVLTRVACAVRLSARTGCSLAAVVTAVEDDLRARVRAETELRAAVAGPRASASVLAGLPVLGLLMGSGVGADPWRVLTTTGPGTVLLVAGVALEGAGLAWSARLVQRAVRR
ncbi:tight adherence protein B [Modestobacter sp. DSM 44400]|uniref:type II secretion system F family protein n=1 Tax=Modestobacter sp. DSM 44400 TaxID=1550230 RepID=UPI0008987E41|nr:type II secretion system F family protein [Modestobacter sp. DSM 44400]SDX70167.1 tight adherence protein B [Modestobacter sp. DSM 44400]